MRQFALTVSLLLIIGCTSDQQDPGPGDAGATKPSTARTTTTNTSERDSWQKPQEVFMLMGNDLRGRTIADLVAGDGYFTFKMIEVGANVIAIDIDPKKLEAIEARKKEMGLGDDRLRTRLGTPTSPGLAPEEVDASLLVHSYVSIPDKKKYFTNVFQGTKEPKALFILEWLNAATPIGPPMSDRISSERVMDEVSVAGYTDIGTYSAKIPYQAFIFASRQPDIDFQEELEGASQEEIMNLPVR